MSAKVKLGRPPNSGQPPRLRSVSLVLDDETSAMLEVLENSYRTEFGHVGRSEIFRYLIVAAHVESTGSSRPAPPWKMRSICHVYFIQRGTGGLIKIGHSRDVLSRQKNLQSACVEQLHLLGTLAGSCRTEQGLHRRFWHLRIKGEWFTPGADLLAYIETLNVKQ